MDRAAIPSCRFERLTIESRRLCRGIHYSQLRVFIGGYRANLVILGHGDFLPVSARHFSAEYSDLACLTETELASGRQVLKALAIYFNADILTIILSIERR